MNKKYYTKSQKHKIGDPIVSKNNIFIVTCTGYSDGKHWYEKTKLNDYIENKSNSKIKANIRDCELRIKRAESETERMKKQVERLSDSSVALRMSEAESGKSQLESLLFEIYERIKSEMDIEEEY